MWLTITVAVILTICILVILKQYQKLSKSYSSIMESYHNLEQLNSVMRVQRHDYLNHMQIVYGMLEVDEYDELKEYLAPIYKDMMKTGKALRTAKPAVNALLSAKNGEAENENIEFYVEVKSNLRELKVPDWEICKVLSNIIDNGITVLKTMDEPRKLEIDITETKDSFLFEIANNGPAIAPDMQEEIFRQGVTSKKEDGHGMGLYIVKSMVKKYKGDLKLTSNEEKTTFFVSFPKSFTKGVN